MKIALRMMSVLLAFALLLAGPLAPLAAAQQPAMPSAARTGDRDDSKAYEIGAGIANAFYIPGKAGLCVLGTGFSVVLLMLTFGTSYKASAAIAREGCGGRWILTGDDLRPDDRDASRLFIERQ